jgi:5-methylcytosine-specific restriction endonuclease McrA
VRRFPVILDHLAAGFVNVTTVKILRPVLTPENLDAVLAKAKYRSKKECELIVARLQPQTDVPSTIRKLPAPPPSPTSVAPDPVAAQDCVGTAAAPVMAAPVHHPVLAPLSPERYKLQFTISKETHDKLRRVQDLLCREVPSGDPAVIFDRALDVLLANVEKKKRAAARNPRPPRSAKEGSDHIPAHVARAVWKRDGNRCAFIGSNGRCTETRYLELHHIQPRAHRGPATIDNISVRCRAHNVYESELIFGPFDASAVRETPEIYAALRETGAVPERQASSVEPALSGG